MSRKGRDRGVATFGKGYQDGGYSTVTLLARLRGLSTSQSRATAMW